MSKKKRRSGPKAGPRPADIASQQLIAGLGEAASHMQRRRWREARDVLEALDDRFPNQADVLMALTEVYSALPDFSCLQTVCERLIRVAPHEPDVKLMLAGSYLVNLRLAMALRAFRSFLEEAPDHPRAPEARTAVSELEAQVAPMLAEMGLSGEDGLEVAALHEEAQSAIAQGHFSQARKLEEQVLRRQPRFAPALNNISQTYMVQGYTDQAIATARSVLEFAPDNVHALANLTQFLCRSGRVAEARECGERLKALFVDTEDAWFKKAEALSYLGDDEGVLEAFHAAQVLARRLSLPEDPFLLHLAAVAAIRCDREAEARRLWRQAVKLDPTLDIAQANLEDLRLPVHERHAPWPFDLPNWMQLEVITDLATRLESAARRNAEDGVTRAVRRFLREHPEVVGVIPILLDRGDPGGREFALTTAVTAETPEMIEALKEFALSARGPDAMRYEAARVASEAGVLPAGTVRMWIQGEWRDIMFMGFELHGEAMGGHSPQVSDWMIEGLEAMRHGKGREAERLFKQALELEPDSLSIWNNLAAACSLQRRHEEAEAILRQLHERDPNYLFARTSLAQMHLSRGETEAAEALLQPLLARKRFHFSEFAAVCQAQIALFQEQGNMETARSWLDMWAAADPENPAIEPWKRHLESARRPRPFYGRRA